MALEQRTHQVLLDTVAELGAVASMLELHLADVEFSKELARRARRAVGIDASAKRIGYARTAIMGNGGPASGPGFVLGAWRTLPFPDRSFDCIVSGLCMCEFKPQARLSRLREMRRVTRRWVVLDYRHGKGVAGRMQTLARTITRSEAPPPRIVTRAELELEVRGAGLAVKSVVPVSRLASDRWIVVAEAPSHHRFR